MHSLSANAFGSTGVAQTCRYNLLGTFVLHKNGNLLTKL
jgi:hypothetical protein